ncbi:MAG: response regulator [Elusimicrobiales bacterium]|nr:response regulator [Elusimicrobiales bacterium]
MKKFYTTSQTAEICSVAHTTVIRWIGEGKIKAHETPGGHRRIEKADLLDFLKRFSMPVPASLEDPRYRVLVVDDEKVMLSMMRKLFDEHASEIELHMAERGMAALLLLGKKHFDLVILDVVMPDMDGVEVCKALRRNPDTADLKIISVTGKQLTEEQEEYLERNTECLLKKPFPPSELLERINTLRGKQDKAL